ncbi:MAG: DUF983 domain-containing protein [Bacteroidota bacterium]|nr:DUF983 domain-containing protein [Bacteroidota bacterium]
MSDFKRAGFMPFMLSRCPRCGLGKVFCNKILSFKKFSDTLEHCSSCGLEYEPETGFFFGAMYWTYALLVGSTAILSILFYYLGYFEQAVYIIPVIILFSLPWVFRYGRLLMLYIVYPIMYKDKFTDKK